MKCFVSHFCNIEYIFKYIFYKTKGKTTELGAINKNSEILKKVNENSKEKDEIDDEALTPLSSDNNNNNTKETQNQEKQNKDNNDKQNEIEKPNSNPMIL